MTVIMGYFLSFRDSYIICSLDNSKIANHNVLFFCKFKSYKTLVRRSVILLSIL